MFVAEAVGRGVMFVSAIGAIFQRQLRAGEQWVGASPSAIAYSNVYDADLRLNMGCSG